MGRGGLEGRSGRPRLRPPRVGGCARRRPERRRRGHWRVFPFPSSPRPRRARQPRRAAFRARGGYEWITARGEGCVRLGWGGGLARLGRRAPAAGRVRATGKLGARTPPASPWCATGRGRRRWRRRPRRPVDSRYCGCASAAVAAPTHCRCRRLYSKTVSLPAAATAIPTAAAPPSVQPQRATATATATAIATATATASLPPLPRTRRHPAPPATPPRRHHYKTYGDDGHPPSPIPMPAPNIPTAVARTLSTGAAATGT